MQMNTTTMMGEPQRGLPLAIQASEPMREIPTPPSRPPQEPEAPPPIREPSVPIPQEAPTSPGPMPTPIQPEAVQSSGLSAGTASQ